MKTSELVEIVNDIQNRKGLRKLDIANALDMQPSDLSRLLSGRHPISKAMELRISEMQRMIGMTDEGMTPQEQMKRDIENLNTRLSVLEGQLAALIAGLNAR